MPASASVVGGAPVQICCMCSSAYFFFGFFTVSETVVFGCFLA